MSILGALIRTAVNVSTLPIDLVKDVVTLGGTLNDQDQTYIGKKFDQIKDEADSD